MSRFIRRLRHHLDIAMPEKDGLEAAREICNASPETVLIFATAYENFTYEAFEVFLTREGRYVIIHTIEGKIKTTETMEALEQKLTGNSFFRCHRGFIINLNMVKEIQP